MREKVEKALNRLNKILPIKGNQEKSSAQVKKLHQQILRSFVVNGRILKKEEMSEFVDDVDGAVDILKSGDMVTFSKSGDPEGAYPFTMQKREHEIQVNGHLVHAMCALDALAIGPMFGETTQITSQCRVTGDPIKITMSGETIQNFEEVHDVQFGIAWEATDSQSCCADSLCMEMIFLRDSDIAQSWLADNSEGKEVFTLGEAVDFSTGFFLPLMS